MSVGLSGNLVDFGIADVFQLIGQQRKTGALELRSEQTRIQMLFSSGMVVSAAPAVSRADDLDPVAERLVRCGWLTRERAEEAANACRAAAQPLQRVIVDRGWASTFAFREAEDLVTRDTIFEVLRWDTGSFDFRAREVVHDRRPTDLLGAEQILMDGLRMVDEWHSFSGVVPTLDVVYSRIGSFERFLESQPRIGAEDRERAEKVFALIDGRLPAHRVLDLARLGVFDGTRCLADLHQGGAIRPVTDGGLAMPFATREPAGDRGAGLRQALSALAPLLALAAVAWFTGSSSALSRIEPAQRVARTSLDGLVHDYATRVVQRAVEAYRLEHGTWPDGLELLVEEGFLPGDALATPEARPYYSMRRKLGPVLLAPEHH